MTIDGNSIWSSKDKPQALADLSSSLHPLTITLNPGQTYHIKIDYSNIIYTGNADVDGCTLFAWNDAGNPSVTLTADDPGDPDEFQQVTCKVYAKVNHLPTGHLASDLTAVWTWYIEDMLHSDTVDGQFSYTGVDGSLFSIMSDNSDLTSPTGTFQGEFDLDGFYEIPVRATVIYRDNRTGQNLGPYTSADTGDVYLGDTGDEPPAGSAASTSAVNASQGQIPARLSPASVPLTKPKVKVTGLRIYLASVDKTGQTATLNAGEQVVLTAQYNTKNGQLTISNPSWSVSNNPIGGWVKSDTAHNNPNASYTIPMPSANATGITFYYTDVTGTTPTPVTFSGTVKVGSANKPFSKTINFIVNKPDTTLTATQHDVSAGDTKGGIRVIVLGGRKYGTGLDGINFTATGGSGGTFSRAQTLTKFSFTDTATSQGQTASANLHNTNTLGLDTEFPFKAATATTTNDSPEVTVDLSVNPNITRIKVTDFSATMYLMWTSAKPNSIPIPVQSLVWSWRGMADTSKGDWEKISGTLPLNHTGTPVKSGVLSWTQIAIAGNFVRD